MRDRHAGYKLFIAKELEFRHRAYMECQHPLLHPMEGEQYLQLSDLAVAWLEKAVLYVVLAIYTLCLAEIC